MIKVTILEGDSRSFETTVALEMQAPIKHFEKELAAIRTGRASTKLIEDLPVDCYGAIMRLKDVASLAAPDARMLTIQPWDKNMFAPIEKAIMVSDIGITPANDGDIIRLQLPQMSSSRRDELVKFLGKKTEECRVNVRNVRKEALNAIKAAKVSEDFAKRITDLLQKVTDNTIKIVDGLADKKAAEIKHI